ncbi:MAG: hypothetical protein L0H19_02640 [Salinisphaera sp.]|nr:hypothetical protein [Salinisphaera sp.]MDN5938065.1 hypothetical protein [Salinisphaera sp.]
MEKALPNPMTVKRWHEFTWKDWLRVVAGLVMLVLGLIGLVFPVLQGVLFLIISALLLAPYSRAVQRLQAWGEHRFPETHRRAHGLIARLTTQRRR